MNDTRKERIMRNRDAAIFMRPGIAAGDRTVEMISREDGLYVITLENIIRINLPDQTDTNLDHEDAPIIQTVFLPLGSRNPFVARTVIQAQEFGKWLMQSRFLDVAWEVMFSLVALDRIVSQIEKSIENTKEVISENVQIYVIGQSPPPVPIVEFLEVDFRTCVLINHHILHAISDLFSVCLDLSFKRGRFDEILKLLRQRFDSSDPLVLMMESDHSWIYCWNEVRNAIEHPRPDYFVRVNNFRLLPNREIQLPTWQIKHSTLDMYRPQAMIEALNNLRLNVLGFYENLLVELVDKAMQFPFPIGIRDIPEHERNPECPKRYAIVGLADHGAI